MGDEKPSSNGIARKRDKFSNNLSNFDDNNNDNGAPKSYICDKCNRQVQYIHKKGHNLKCQDEQRSASCEREENVYVCIRISTSGPKCGKECGKVIQYKHQELHNKKFHSTETDDEIGSTDTSTY